MTTNKKTKIITTANRLVLFIENQQLEHIPYTKIYGIYRKGDYTKILGANFCVELKTDASVHNDILRNIYDKLTNKRQSFWGKVFKW